MQTFLFDQSSAWLRLGVLSLSFAAAAANVGCSSSTSPPSEAAAACTALGACCAAMSGSAATACQAMVTAGQSAGDTTCAATLQSYAQSGLCGAGAGSFDAGALPDIDATVPCDLTGTCTSSFDAGPGFDANPWLPPPEDSGNPDPQDSAPPPPVDAGPDCGTPPALHPESQPGVYCPFTAAGAIHCPATEQCCEAPSDAGGAASTCELSGVTCPVGGSLLWQCDGPVDCAGSDAGAVCCGAGAVHEDTVCGFHRGSGFTGSHCATSCAATEVPICDAVSDPCPTGTTCTPFKTEGVVLGTCL